jgi:VCBS repeat-containing protein
MVLSGTSLLATPPAADAAAGESDGSSLSGFVYLDADEDGVRDAGEMGVPGVLVSLSGTADGGETISRSAITVNSGRYQFADLPAGTYQIVESQPTALVDGPDADPAIGSADDDQFTEIVVSAGAELAGYDFGEMALHPEYVSLHWFLASSGEPENQFRQMMALAEEQAGNHELAEAIRSGETELPEGTNRPPLAAADSYSTPQDEMLTVAATEGVLANDTDADGDLLTAEVATEPDHGVLELQEDGSFTYTPDSGFAGTDSFTYTVSDGAGSATGTVTLTVTAEAGGNSFAVPENSPPGTLVGTVEDDGEAVIYELEDPDVADELKLRPDDHLSGDPAAALVLIEYVDYECPPCAVYHEAVRDLQDQFGDDLLVVRRHFPLTQFHDNAVAAARAAEAAARQDDFEGMSDLLFQNQAAWAGVEDPEPYFLDYADQLGLDTTQFLEDLADPALDERIDRDRDDAQALGVAGTPTFFLNGQQLDPASPDDLEAELQAARDDFDEPFVVDRTSGDLYVATGGLNFESTPEYSLRVETRDETGATTVVAVTVDVLDVNEAPRSASDFYSVSQGGILAVNAPSGVLANDQDEDGDPITAARVSEPVHGQVTVNPDGSFRYTPDADYTGPDVFTYQASDGELSSEPTTVSITVRELNQAPGATPDEYEVDEDQTLTVSAAEGVLANDNDDDPLTARLVTPPQHGELVSFDQDGGFVYVPQANFHGTDQFTYDADDGELASVETTVVISVRPVNDAPVVEDDAYEMDENAVLTVPVDTGLLANDSDVEGESLSAAVVTQPPNGSLAFNSDGSFEYTPDAGFSGTDSFTYAASDGQDSTEGLVTIRVNDTNTPPTGGVDTYMVDEDQVLTVSAAEGVLANDQDAEGDPLTAILVEDPVGGTVTLNEDGSFEYIPDRDFHGLDGFAYRASDGGSTSAEILVGIIVNAVSDPPLAVDDWLEVEQDAVLTRDAESGLLNNDTDADGDPITATLVDPADNGEIELNPDGSFTYTPDPGFNGLDSFTYTVSDGTHTSNLATVIIDVLEPGEVPTEDAGSDGSQDDETAEGEAAWLVDAALADEDQWLV